MLLEVGPQNVSLIIVINYYSEQNIIFANHRLFELKLLRRLNDYKSHRFRIKYF